MFTQQESLFPTLIFVPFYTLCSRFYTAIEKQILVKAWVNKLIKKRLTCGTAMVCASRSNSEVKCYVKSTRHALVLPIILFLISLPSSLIFPSLPNITLGPGSGESLVTRLILLVQYAVCNSKDKTLVKEVLLSKTKFN